MLWLLDYVSQVSSRLVIFCFDIVNHCAHEDNIREFKILRLRTTNYGWTSVVLLFAALG